MVQMIETPTAFGARLREERKRLKLNQWEFGALGGVTNNSQLHYEKGVRRPDSAYLEAVAAHGVDVTYLITGHRQRPCSCSETAAVEEEAVYVLTGRLHRLVTPMKSLHEAVPAHFAAIAPSA